ncbi:MAG: hypothetical protein KAS32_03575, partial [Candidatus Peribacteraceae bacterium]|nr:hypothetical protein [Candidatus Peribacteraceae bacterium]
MSPNRNPRRQPPTDKKTPKEVPKWDDFRSKESREGFEARLNKYEERINEFNDRFDAVNIRVDVTIRSLQNKANLFPEGSRQRKFYEKWYKNVVDAKTEFYNKARFLDRISKKKFHELESREDLDLWRDVRGRHLQDFSIPGQNMWEETEHHVVMEQQRYVEDLNSIVDNFSKANKREVKYTGAFAFALKEITNREVREVRVHLELIKINKDDEELRKRLKQEVYEALDLINKEGSVLYTHRDASPVARARIEQLLSIRERMLDEAFSHFPEDRGLQFNLKGVRERNSNYLLSRAIEDDKYIAPLKEAKKEEQNSLEYIAEKYKTFT